jgi:hypothetical protein
LATIKRLAAGWAPRLLNSAGREVVIKAICQAIPTYCTSCFKLSKKLSKKITSLIARFWWGGDEYKRKMHWITWEDLSIPKSCGGMGFKDFVLFNKAMLAKQGWRLISNPDSLCAKVLRGKYYHNGDIITAGKKRNSSHTWSAILFGREALHLGMIKRIGNGETTRMWHDHWIPSNPGLKPIVTKPGSDVSMVQQLLDPLSGEWNEDVLKAKFEVVDVQAILKIPTGGMEDDMWAWKLERHGNFTMRSAYKALLQAKSVIMPAANLGGSEQSFWKKLWRINVPPKVRNFWWRVIKGFIHCRQIQA